MFNSTFKGPRKGMKRSWIKRTATPIRSVRRKADTVWAKAVKERDGYCCQRCGRYDLNNHAHHLATRARRPDLKYDVDNGKTLCPVPCHEWVHQHPVEATAAGLLSSQSYEVARRET